MHFGVLYIRISSSQRGERGTRRGSARSLQAKSVASTNIVGSQGCVDLVVASSKGTQESVRVRTSVAACPSPKHSTIHSARRYPRNGHESLLVLILLCANGPETYFDPEMRLANTIADLAHLQKQKVQLEKELAIQQDSQAAAGLRETLQDLTEQIDQKKREFNDLSSTVLPPIRTVPLARKCSTIENIVCI